MNNIKKIRPTKEQHIVIIGAGFGGLQAAKELTKHKNKVRITLIDRHNYHLFQPLLYQVATGQLSPEDIAYPIRSIFAGKKNVTVLKALVQSVDLDKQSVILCDFALSYDYLIIGCGVQPDYFGHDKWAKFAPGLKTLQDALYMRMRILNAFEYAERKQSPHTPNIVIIGAGPTGVELSGALAELSKIVLKNDFRRIHPDRTHIYLIEASPHILPGFSPKLVWAAEKALNGLGVTVLLNTMVTQISENNVEIQKGNQKESIPTQTVLWAAGVKAANTTSFLQNAEQVKKDKKNRIIVNEHLSIDGHNNVFVIGDLAYLAMADDKPLPGIAPVAMQQGRYIARRIIAGLKGKTVPPFRYRNKGQLAVIGRNKAIADFGFMEVKGSLAWLAWVFVHIAYLIGFQKKMLVLLNWAWNYIKPKSSARIVFGCEDKDVGHPLPKCPE